jgi:hypothetical protein
LKSSIEIDITGRPVFDAYNFHTAIHKFAISMLEFYDEKSKQVEDMEFKKGACFAMPTGSTDFIHEITAFMQKMGDKAAERLKEKI